MFTRLDNNDLFGNDRNYPCRKTPTLTMCILCTGNGCPNKSYLLEVLRACKNLVGEYIGRPQVDLRGVPERYQIVTQPAENGVYVFIHDLDKNMNFYGEDCDHDDLTETIRKVADALKERLAEKPHGGMKNDSL